MIHLGGRKTYVNIGSKAQFQVKHKLHYLCDHKNCINIGFAQSK